MSKVKTVLRSCTFAGLLFGLTSETSNACGIDWNAPLSHFSGVDFQGHVHVVQKLEDIKTESGSLPLSMIFNSSYGTSPYGGVGFEFPLLEAKMLQVDENTFLLRNPAGWLWPFVRSKDKNVLDGSAGWRAVINGDSMTAWAPCGGKMVFYKGRITRLETKDFNLDYIYSGSLLSEVREGSNVLIKIRFSSNTGEFNGLILGLNKVIQVQKAERPRVQTIGHANTISAIDSSISQVTLSNGSMIKFAFGLNEKLQPTMNMNNRRLFTWNAETGNIVSDGDWQYKISRDVEAFSYATIKRSRSTGEKETWQSNPMRGEESFSHADGFTRKRLWFTSGRLAGRPRSIVDSINGVEVRNRKWNYSEEGQLLLMIDTAKNDFPLQRKLLSLVTKEHTNPLP